MVSTRTGRSYDIPTVSSEASSQRKTTATRSRIKKSLQEEGCDPDAPDTQPDSISFQAVPATMPYPVAQVPAEDAGPTTSAVTYRAMPRVTYKRPSMEDIQNTENSSPTLARHAARSAVDAVQHVLLPATPPHAGSVSSSALEPVPVKGKCNAQTLKPCSRKQQGSSSSKAAGFNRIPVAVLVALNLILLTSGLLHYLVCPAGSSSQVPPAVSSAIAVACRPLSHVERMLQPISSLHYTATEVRESFGIWMQQAAGSAHTNMRHMAITITHNLAYNVKNVGAHLQALGQPVAAKVQAILPKRPLTTISPKLPDAGSNAVGSSTGKAVGFQLQLSLHKFLTLLPSSAGWPDLATDFFHVAAMQQGEKGKAAGMVLAARSEAETTQAIVALRGALPQAFKCLLELKGSSFEESGTLQANLAAFLKRCPAGIVVFAGIEFLPLSYLNVVNNVLSEFGGLTQDGHTIPACQSIFIFLVQTSVIDVDPGKFARAVKDELVAQLRSAEDAGRDPAAVVSAFRRRIDFVAAARAVDDITAVLDGTTAPENIVAG